jgi:hypothetical protein
MISLYNLKNSRIIFHCTLIVTWFLFSLPPIDAQTENTVYCEEPSTWDKIQISDRKIPEGAAKLLIVTNRPYIPEAVNLEYFPNDIASYRKVSYLIATCNGQRWQLSFVSCFTEGMQVINDGRDILLFVEGHGKTLPMVLSRAHQVQTRYNVALVVFDWPSKNRNFNNSLARVRRCGDNFYNLLLQIKDYRRDAMHENQHFSILAHSLGNYFLSNLIVCGDGQYLKEQFIDNIVMNAAAIRSKEHGEVLSQLGFHKRLYITSNKNDWVLRGAHLLTSGKMLGNFAIPPLATKAHYLNFTGIVGKEHSYYYGHHPFECTNPAFFYFYNTAIHGNEVNLQDTVLFLPRDSGDGYDIRNSVNGLDHE